mmetsp:Transcript_54087/g.96226  ORF Transcript_54087/g.96226 Transcript_54087/m.96226 type:complete len:303 (-) Transcript_54087:312-1220(-)
MDGRSLAFCRRQDKIRSQNGEGQSAGRCGSQPLESASINAGTEWWNSSRGSAPRAKISQSIRPKDHMSHFGTHTSGFSRSLMHSGAVLRGLGSPWVLRLLQAFASPKSATLITSFIKSMFRAARSRWTIPWRCMCRKPLAHCAMNSTRVGTISGCFALGMCLLIDRIMSSRSYCMSSRMMDVSPFDRRQMPYRRRRLGCRSICAITLASSTSAAVSFLSSTFSHARIPSYRHSWTEEWVPPPMQCIRLIEVSGIFGKYTWPTGGAWPGPVFRDLPRFGSSIHLEHISSLNRLSAPQWGHVWK